MLNWKKIHHQQHLQMTVVSGKQPTPRKSGGVSSQPPKVEEDSKKTRSKKNKKRKKNKLSKVPDEILVEVFRFLSPHELARSIALVCKRFCQIFPCSVQIFELRGGKIRKLKEDTVVGVIRRFVRLEQFDICNNGSSEDFQLSDKGLLQLAHKFIYSDADLLAREPKTTHVLEGDYDFNFDYESHLDSLDSLVSLSVATGGEEVDGLNTELDMMTVDSDGELAEMDTNFTPITTSRLSSSQLPQNQILGSSKRISTKVKHYSSSSSNPYSFGTKIILPGFAELQQQQQQQLKVDNSKTLRRASDAQTDSDSNTTFTTESRPEYYMTYKHSYYYYPPPKPKLLKKPNKTKPLDEQQQQQTKGPCYGLRTLKKINLTGCHGITDKGVMYLTYICSNLSYLNLKGCNKIDDGALKHLVEFSKLETLVLTGCTHITDEGMKNLSACQSNGKLQNLDVTFCHQITDQGIKYISDLKSLLTLDLTCCRKVTHLGLQYLADNCPHLLSLNLTGCDQIIFCEMTKGFLNIEKLAMMGCKFTCDHCLKFLVKFSKNLTDLCVAYSELVTDEGIANVIINCPNLSILNLKKCSNITDKVLFVASEYLKESMVSLNVTGARMITNQGLKALAMSLRNLRELSLRKCLQITDVGLGYLHSCRFLESLDLSECPLITDDGIRGLCEQLCEGKPTIDKRKENSILPTELLTKIFPNISENKVKKNCHQGGLRDLKIEKSLKISKEFVDMLQHRYKLTVSYVQ